MTLAFHTPRSPNNKSAQDAIDELCRRFRSLTGLPVQLVVVEQGTRSEFDVTVITGSRKSLTWVWLAYDNLTHQQRRLIRLLPFTLAEAKRDPVLADHLRAHLNWERPELRRRRKKATFLLPE